MSQTKKSMTQRFPSYLHWFRFDTYLRFSPREGWRILKKASLPLLPKPPFFHALQTGMHPYPFPFAIFLNYFFCHFPLPYPFTIYLCHIPLPFHFTIPFAISLYNYFLLEWFPFIMWRAMVYGFFKNENRYISGFLGSLL